MEKFLIELIKTPFLLILIISIIFIIIGKFYYAAVVGYFGELWTKLELKKLPKNKYKVLNNLLIKVDDKTHQIDHVVISNYGIFVIETKQYNGYIKGNKYDKNWLVYLGNRKYNSINPIRQNYGHVMSLIKLLNIDISKIYNIVCITSRAKINIKDDGETLKVYDLNNKILSYNKEIIYNIDDIYNKLNNSNIVDKNIRKEHINNIKNNK